MLLDLPITSQDSFGEHVEYPLKASIARRFGCKGVPIPVLLDLCGRLPLGVCGQLPIVEALAAVLLSTEKGLIASFSELNPERRGSGSWALKF